MPEVEFSPERRKNDQRQANTSIEEQSINQKRRKNHGKNQIK